MSFSWKKTKTTYSFNKDVPKEVTLEVETKFEKLFDKFDDLFSEFNDLFKEIEVNKESKK